MKSTVCTTLVLALAACGGDKTDAEFQADVVASMHDSIIDDVDALILGGRNLQASAPNRAWNATRDADAINEMRESWRRTRVAYEHIEGATAPIFADLDASLDA